MWINLVSWYVKPNRQNEGEELGVVDSEMSGYIQGGYYYFESLDNSGLKM